MAGVKAAFPRVSYAELERWPEDGRRYELYDGEVFEIPTPILLHQLVLGRLYVALVEYVRVHGGLVAVAPLDIILTQFDVVQPDIVYFTPERRSLLDVRSRPRIPPDLAIEVLSPGTAANDRGRKLRLLETHGVCEYWLVDVDAPAVEVYLLDGGRFRHPQTARAADRIASSLLPELHLLPADLVRD